ncbi:hypoxanthine-guanine phosphoribosyltransferase [Marilutibacter chinensis]|uniref:Hypoxanthine-guanine phosphoribosyltransferase n=1 Tax=Marilutibacter chinensis TaxID=2912247 RepID=A0ABS9HY78_9GAMM|nr:hypoxanthine-guanine phosphoribosyltransferase [Lysobacter chinensis]MCF7223511.1 hypoxanthine-guanine phosphoribosyltransferase [Lysobacter chinensis]
MSGHDLAWALEHSEVVVEQHELEAAVARMADAIRADYDEPPVFLTIMHGGLPFAARLAMELGARGLDLAFDYLHATRYRGETRGADLVWKHRPATPLAGRRVLLADDILDEGHTLAEIIQWCREQGASDVRVAVLTVKQHDRCVPGVRADYAGVEVPDRYVFGYGMDFHEQGRNLPAIYALKDPA